MYFDEDLLLDIRLNCLNKYVKKFVIAEATYTHNGNPKRLKFDVGKFKKFRDKITYIIVDKEPENITKLSKNDTKDQRGEKLILNGMARDYFQRQSLTKGIKDADKNDLILISDLDEVPSFENINLSKINNQVVIFEQKMLYYKLNLLYEDYNWLGTRAVKKKNLISPQWLRNIKGRNYPKWRIDILFSKKKYSNLFFVKNGGWHFTCLKSAEELEKKLLNFAHHYEYQESALNLEKIKQFINEKRVIYDHNVDQKQYKWSGEVKLKKIESDLLPRYIQSNLEKYKDWID